MAKAKAKGYTFTKADAAKYRTTANLPPEKRLAISKGLVESNNAANRMPSKGKA